MARNLLSVGGKTPQKKAVGLSLSDDGRVSIDNPKANYVIGSVVEPHSEGYQGVLAVMGVECYSSLTTNTISTGSFVGSNILRVGSNFLHFGPDNILRYDMNMSLLDDIVYREAVGHKGSTIQALNVGDNIVAISLPTAYAPYGKELELYLIDKRTLVTKKHITIPRTADNYNGTRDVYASSHISHLFVISTNELRRYDANLNLLSSIVFNEDLRKPRMLGVIGNKVIIGHEDSSGTGSIDMITMYHTSTLEQLGSPVELEDNVFRAGFIEGNNFIGVGKDYLVKIDTANTNNVIVTRLRSELGSSYAPKNISYMNGMIAVVTSSDGYKGSAAYGKILTILEYDPDYGAKRVYQITNVSSGDIFRSHIDELDRVWVISEEGQVAGIKLLSSELVLKGYRVVGG